MNHLNSRNGDLNDSDHEINSLEWITKVSDDDNDVDLDDNTLNIDKMNLTPSQQHGNFDKTINIKSKSLQGTNIRPPQPLQQSIKCILIPISDDSFNINVLGTWNFIIF